VRGILGAPDDAAKLPWRSAVKRDDIIKNAALVRARAKRARIRATRCADIIDGEIRSVPDPLGLLIVDRRTGQMVDCLAEEEIIRMPGARVLPFTKTQKR
jgi:hypothetical protein